MCRCESGSEPCRAPLMERITTLRRNLLRRNLFVPLRSRRCALAYPFAPPHGDGRVECHDARCRLKRARRALLRSYEGLRDTPVRVRQQKGLLLFGGGEDGHQLGSERIRQRGSMPGVHIEWRRCCRASSHACIFPYPSQKPSHKECARGGERDSFWG